MYWYIILHSHDTMWTTKLSRLDFEPGSFVNRAQECQLIKMLWGKPTPPLRGDASSVGEESLWCYRCRWNGQILHCQSINVLQTSFHSTPRLQWIRIGAPADNWIGVICLKLRRHSTCWLLVHSASASRLPQEHVVYGGPDAGYGRDWISLPVSKFLL